MNQTRWLELAKKMGPSLSSSSTSKWAQVQAQQIKKPKFKPKPTWSSWSFSINRDTCHSFKEVFWLKEELKLWSTEALKNWRFKLLQALKTCKFVSTSRSTTSKRLKTRKINFLWISEDHNSKSLATTTS